ncbi:MAG: hypothetical protein Fur0018_20690 [Anaerolineales bacterium]
MNPRDLRKYASQTQVRSLLAFIVILFTVGLGLIYVFYGPGSAMMGALCALGGLAPLVLIFLFLWGLDWFLHRFDDR